MKPIAAFAFLLALTSLTACRTNDGDGGRSGGSSLDATTATEGPTVAAEKTLELKSAPLSSGKAVNIFVRYTSKEVTVPGDSVETKAVIAGFCVARLDQRLDVGARAVLVKACTSTPGGKAPTTSEAIELRSKPREDTGEPFSGESSFCYVPAGFLEELRLTKKLTGGLVERCSYALAVAFQENGGDEWLVDPVRASLPEPENHNFQLTFKE